LLEARFGFSKMKAGKTPPLAGGPSMLSMFGITGLPTDPQYTGGVTYEYFVDGGFTSLGRLFTSPQYQNPTDWNPKVSYTRMLPVTPSAWARVHYAPRGAGGSASRHGRRCLRRADERHMLHDLWLLCSCWPAYHGPADAETNKMYDYADFLLGYRTEMGLSSPTLPTFVTLDGAATCRMTGK